MYSYENLGYPPSMRSIYPSALSEYPAPIRHFLNEQPSCNDYRCISKKEADFKAMNQLLWMEHVNWTRMTIISIVFGLPDLPFVQERLLRNATDLGNSLRPFYGDQIANRYTELIKDHLTIAAELVTAATKGDAITAKLKEEEWYRNADDIVAFLTRINPYLHKAPLQQMFYTHLKLTKEEAVNIIQKNYKEGVAVFDLIEAEALAMSDMIASAIVCQFFGFFSPFNLY
ncbi:hypothetical protein [Solibacillus palustris]